MLKPTTPPSPLAAPFRPGLRIAALVTIVICIALALAGQVQPVVLGAVQGLAEFLPISSSAHLILAPWLLGWQGGAADTLTFDVALHLGTLIAVVGYFWRDWLQLLAAVPEWLGGLAAVALGDRSRKLSPAATLLQFVVIATIPGGIAGVLLDSWAEGALRSPLLLAVTLPLMGLLLYLADRNAPQQIGLEQMVWRDALLIGLAQAFAIIPGVSRSGVTITMGRYRTLDRTAAARFSFLLSAPITAAAVLFKANSILHIPADEVSLFVVGVVISAAVGALAIGGLLAYIRRTGFAIFAGYRVALALVILLVLVARR
jgi:undecaprenyl-diphosphatase